jgi:hypothetical protein
MAGSRRELDALFLGERTIAAVRRGEFRRLSTQKMAEGIRRTLSLLSSRALSFGSPESTWAILREMTAQTLLSLASTERLREMRNVSTETGAIGGSATGFGLSPAYVLFGSDDPRFADIELTDADQATARLIGTYATAFVDVIPTRFRDEAFPPQARSPPSVVPHVEVNIDTERIEKTVGELGDKLAAQVDSRITAGFERIESSLPLLVRGIGVGVGAPAPGRPMRTLLEEAPPTSAETVSPLGPSAPAGPPPKTRRQENLFGEAVPAPGRPLGAIGVALEDKYRPVFLKDVIGNSASVQLLKAAAETGNFAKAYVVQGPPGTGKTTAVMAAIRDYLLPRQESVGVPLFNPSFSPNSPTWGIDPAVVLYRNAETLVTRGNVATLLGDISRYTKTLGHRGIRRFIVIDDVTKFSKEQQEVLLPLTERYPTTTIFFIANDPDYIEALRSRVKTIRWTRPEPVAVEMRLVDIIQGEGMPFPNPAVEARTIVQGLGLNLEFRQALIRLAADALALGGPV